MVQEAEPIATEDSARALEKKRDILRAASVVFRRKGLHAAGMREIAAEAGMHASNLYYYFANKQELLAFCQRDSLRQLMAMARRVTASESSPEDHLRQLIIEHVRILNEAIPGSLAHLDVEALESPWRERIRRQRDEYEEAFRQVIRKGVTTGHLRPVDPKIAGLAILGAINWTVKWFQPDGERTAASVGADLAEHLVRGLRT